MIVYGHGVTELLKVYANDLDGHGETANGRIEAAPAGRALFSTLVLGVELEACATAIVASGSAH
jgi:hypothetical protein